MKITKKEVNKLVENLLKEDKASADITSNYFVDKNQEAKACQMFHHLWPLFS